MGSLHPVALGSARGTRLAWPSFLSIAVTVGVPPRRPSLCFQAAHTAAASVAARFRHGTWSDMTIYGLLRDEAKLAPG
jgi:hypothetical protein